MNPDDEKRILIVDDQSLILQAMTLILEPYYTIVTAINGEEGLLAAHADPPPDLILLDIKMPGIDGYEVCSRLKADQDTRDIPVIFVTALDRKQDEIRGFEVGAVDYVAKPIVQKTLLARVHIHLALEESLQKLKENQKIIEARNAELDEMNQLKNKFIGIAAHDLRNPIVSILGFTEVLLSEEQLSTEDTRRYLGIISAACNKMLDLISDTLDVSVIESGELILNLGIGALADLVNERVQLFEPIATKKNIDIVKQLSYLGDSWFDPSRVAQVLDNLISNAIKFSPHGTEVSVTLEEVGDLVMISIKDQGPGVPDKDKLKIFNRFQKLQNKPTAGESSTGLGLAIVKKIVDVHHGTLMLESEPGKGATFSFALPRENIQT